MTETNRYDERLLALKNLRDDAKIVDGQITNIEECLAKAMVLMIERKPGYAHEFFEILRNINEAKIFITHIINDAELERVKTEEEKDNGRSLG